MTVITTKNEFTVVPSRQVEPIRLLIAEETPMGCQLLRDTLKRSRLGLEITHCVVTSSQITHLVAENEIDVALISEDLQDGVHEGLRAIHRLRATHPNIRCVVLVRFIGPELTLEAFRSGAKGVFCRKEPIEALWKCIRAVHKRQIWIDSEQQEVILNALVETQPIRVRNSQGACLLTRRENEIGSLVSEGLTNREVAVRLGISEHTVSNYLFKIYEKLGISRRVELVLYWASRRQQNWANS